MPKPFVLNNINALSSVSKGTNPDSSQYTSFAIIDNNSNKANKKTTRLGIVEYVLTADGTSSMNMAVYPFIKNASDWTNSALTVRYTAAGVAQALANGKEIVTVDSSGSDWIRYNNGLQICWGTYSQTAQTTTQNTYAKEFKSGTVPAITATPVQSSATSNTTDLRIVTVAAITNTKFNVLTGIVSTSGTISNNSSCTGRYIAIGYWK